MITINFEAATGADLRKEMLDLLGISGTNTLSISGADIARIGQDKSVITTIEGGVVTDIKEVEETPKPETTTRKRRSKAEIEAEALAANTGSEEPPASTENVETPVEETPVAEEAGGVAVTAEDLTKKCVELGRNGKRDLVLAVFEGQFGGATISKKDGKPQLTAEQYPAVMEALNAIA
jgi:hypothetical protein